MATTVDVDLSSEAFSSKGGLARKLISSSNIVEAAAFIRMKANKEGTSGGVVAIEVHDANSKLEEVAAIQLDDTSEVILQAAGATAAVTETNDNLVLDIAADAYPVGGSLKFLYKGNTSNGGVRLTLETSADGVTYVEKYNAVLQESGLGEVTLPFTLT